MNAALRHFAVRFWLTAFAGGMVGIWILPWWQQVMGVKWLILPSMILMAGCFIGSGWLMNLIGMGFLQRHVNEAAAWERAGMTAESESAFGKAMAAFDSYWISPLLRRGKFQWFSEVMARFYMGRQSESPFARTWVAAHLRQFPQDAPAAEPWLESLLAYERHTPLEHEAVVLISQRLGRHRRIQRLLMQFYLVNGRTDFDAVQTYRRVWQEKEALPSQTVRDLARVLLNDHVLNAWALEIYLAAHEAGDEAALEGIAAAVRWLPATEESRDHLQTARKVMDDPERPVPDEPSLARFKPVQAAPRAPKRRRLKKTKPPSVPNAKETISKISAGLGFSAKQSGRRVGNWPAALPVRHAMPAVIIGLSIALMTVVGWRLYHHPAKQPAPQPEIPKPVQITDPFTIQVAAYLKSEDARRFVEQLKQAGLDAFWTQAASANRSWFQVKVSHFATREAAQAYGRDLKAKGLIDDFYVANYEHSSRGSGKP